MVSWLRVTRNKPCAVCGKPDWCCYTHEGYVMCQRSDGHEEGWDTVKYIPSNGGYVMRPKGHVHKPTPRREKVKATAKILWEPIVKGFELSSGPRPHAGLWLERKLNIPLIFLEMFGLGWSEGHKAFTFPMRDQDRNIVGVRLRHIDGSKRSIKGSKDGLFMQPFDCEDPVLITEGPTDAAALTSLGFGTIGRPSCLGGTEIIAKIARKRDVVIVSDKDEPGQRGAEQLAARLVPISNGIKIIEPTGTAKDARDWVNKGATNEVVEMVIKQAVDYRRKKIQTGQRTIR